MGVFIYDAKGHVVIDPAAYTFATILTMLIDTSGYIQPRWVAGHVRPGRTGGGRASSPQLTAAYPELPHWPSGGRQTGIVIETPSISFNAGGHSYSHKPSHQVTMGTQTSSETVTASKPPKKIAILGAGVTGLVLAQGLQKVSEWLRGCEESC